METITLTRKGALIADLTPYIPNTSSIIVTNTHTELMVGTVTHAPVTDNQDYKDALQVGVRFICKPDNPHTNQLFILPLGGQRLLDEGSYAVSLQGILATIDEV